jgi:hypothetical protein
LYCLHGSRLPTLEIEVLHENARSIRFGKRKEKSGK